MVIKNQIQLEVRYIDETMGFGVFASQDIDEGTIVETCYSIKTYNQVFNPCIDYLFSLSNTESLLPLGYGSIYNHSYTPNIHWRIVNMEKPVIEFYALKKIRMGDELCHNYGQQYWKVREKKLL
jgi:hypothetical protein